MGTVGRTGGEIPLGEIRPEMNVQTAQAKVAFASKPQALPLSKSIVSEPAKEMTGVLQAREAPKEARVFADLALLKGLKRSLDKVVGGLMEKRYE